MFGIKHLFLFFILLLFCFKHSYSQELLILQEEIKHKTGKDKVEKLLKIAQLFSEKYAQPDSVIHYAKQANNISEEIEFLDGKQRSCLKIAVAYQNKNLFDTSTVILNTLLNGLNKNNGNKIIGDIKLNLGLNARFLNDTKQATGLYIQALAAYEKANDYNGMAIANCRLAGVFTLEKQFDVALQYARKTILLLPKSTDPFCKITTLSGLSGIFIQLATSKKFYTDSSIVYAKAALELIDKYKYYTKGNQICISISNAYFYKEDYPKALNFCKKSLDYKNFLYPSEILISYITFSDCYYQLKDHKKAIAYLDSVKICLSSNYDPYYDMLVSERIGAYNEEIGNYKDAIKGHKRHAFLKDSLFNIEKSHVINELEQRYNKSENEKSINELNRKNELASLRVKFLVVGILAALLILLIIIFFYRQSVLKNKFKSLETQQRLNRARMDPHFFFNALASIQTLSMDKENNGKVSQLISQFSKIMRQSLESTYDELTNIETEIIFLNNYLNIQKTRFESKFDFEIKTGEDVDVYELMIPGMLLQPFIENSIEHGFKNINYKGLINIGFTKNKEQLVVTLSDNGKGINENQTDRKHTSRATQIISERLFILNKQYSSKASFTINANDAGRGTIVTLTLPIIYNNK